MDIETLREYALRCKAATEDIKWEDHLCFSVGAKMFLLTSPAAVPVTACFKVSEEDFDLLCERPEFRQAPHFAKRKWIYVDDINALSSKEWKLYLQRSYESVVAKLTKKLRAELGI
ncbi:MmcQ/YjbR family DNA-binding protein [Rurimicrobium arvi]|uniref:MmcQ/YjbR family DNA-binding protein n=1 Tax=Rurimicrobium arvi TaxID=2049916 RepID=A0ABP8MSV3_9BACT